MPGGTSRPGARPLAGTRRRVQPQFIVIVTLVCSLAAAISAWLTRAGTDADISPLWIILVTGLVGLGALGWSLQAARRDRIEEVGVVGMRHSYGPEGRGRWERLGDHNGAMFGLHRDRRDDRAEYVPRRPADDNVRAGLRDAPVLVLYGPERAGKTRTLLEAVRTGYDDPIVLITHAGALSKDVAEASTLFRRGREPVVFWFRSWEEGLVAAITRDILKFLSDTGSRVVVEATVADHRRSRPTVPPQWRVVRLDGELTHDEWSEAREIVGRYGVLDDDEDLRSLGWVLSEDLDPAVTVDDLPDPLVVAVIEAVVEWDRTGAPRGPSATEIRRLLRGPTSTGLDVPDDLGPALRTATSRPEVGAAALRTDYVADQAHYSSSRRLREAVAQRRAVHPDTWSIVAGCLSPRELAPVLAAARKAEEWTVVADLERRSAAPGRGPAPRPIPFVSGPPSTNSPLGPAARTLAPPGSSRARRLPHGAPALAVAVLAAALVGACSVLFLPSSAPSAGSAETPQPPPAVAAPSPAVAAPSPAVAAPSPALAAPSPSPSAEEQLVAMVAADRANAEVLVDRWAARVSGKYDGVRDANGIRYRYPDILADARRARPFATLLVRSGEWPATFDKGRDLWVVLTTVSFGSREEAVEWCDGQGLRTSNECFATRLSRGGDPRSNSWLGPEGR